MSHEENQDELRLALTERVQALQAELTEVQAERDALAAHVERLRAALIYSSEYLYGSHLNNIGHGSKAHMEMVSALEDTPTTSLARLKAEWQAEALHDLLMHPRVDVRQRAVEMRDDYRRQAEESDQ